MSIRTYQPQVRVKLVKVVKRQFVAKKVFATLSRYWLNDGIDLTPLLGDTGGVRTRKSVREPSGVFSITLSDQRHPDFFESIYALVEPMDMIEIRVAHDPSDYSEDWVGYKVPILMRGFVTSVSRSETMANGEPRRHVTIMGHDFGKLLQIIRIYYLNGSVVGDNILSGLSFFYKYANSSDAKMMTAENFVSLVLEKIVAPYVKKLLALTNPKLVSAKAMSEWELSSTVAGTVSPFALASMNDVSIYDMLTHLLDVGPFNELYVEDLEDRIAFIVRPAPMKTPEGKWIQKTADGSDATTDTIEIDSSDVVSMAVTRDDLGVSNYYWVNNDRWTMMHNEMARMVAMTGEPSSFMLFDYLNTKADFFGFRKMEVTSMLGPPGYSQADTFQEKTFDRETQKVLDWIVSRRTMLAELNKDNLVFERGNIILRGNEAVKPGRYLKVTRGVAQYPSEYYVVAAEHEFRPFGGFTTSLQVERGTGFISRAESIEPAYLGEIDAGGVGNAGLG